MEKFNVVHNGYGHTINKNINTKILKPKSSFHQQIINNWHLIHNSYPLNTMDILNQYILYNQYIQIDNKHIETNLRLIYC